MRNIIFALAFFSLFMCAFAYVEATYEIDGLRITRSLENSQVSSVSAITGAATYSYSASVRITITNTGQFAKENIRIADTVSYVPSGAKLIFSSQPYLNATTATWSIGSLLPSAQYLIYINASGKIDEAAFSQLPSPIVSFSLPQARLTAPKESSAGGRITISLSNTQGQPIEGATLFVLGPNGESLSLKTDQQGKASYVPRAAGFYTYSSEDFSLPSMLVSTNAKAALPTAPPAAGAITPESNVPEILPFALGLAVLAAIAFAIYVLFAPRNANDEQPYSSLPPSASPPSGAAAQGGKSGEALIFGQDVQDALHQSGTQQYQTRQYSYQQPQAAKTATNEKGVPAAIEAATQKEQQWVQEQAKKQEDASELFLQRKQELEQKEKEAEEFLKKPSAQMHAGKAIHTKNYQEQNEPEEEPGEDSIEKTIAELERMRAKLKASK
ncbi:hypothetical protein J4441_03685 [Candidatus Micrarchaeota archaeon]|nr:hypothetical protein [Candidatus Micrarchaeota archaeon]